MLGYLGIVLTLIGAIVGLLGETRDKHKRGWRSLTLYGWAALAVVLAGFVISVVTNYEQQERNRRLQASAAHDIEEGWRALIYPFTLMLWQTEGHSVGYDGKELQQLLNPKTFSEIGNIDIRGEAPHYSGPWRTVLSNASRNGKAALVSAEGRFNTFLDDHVIVSVQDVLASRYLDVLTVSDSLVDQVDGSPAWHGMPYPLRNLADSEQCKRYISRLLALQVELEKYLPSDNTRSQSANAQ